MSTIIILLIYLPFLHYLRLSNCKKTHFKLGPKESSIFESYGNCLTGRNEWVCSHARHRINLHIRNLTENISCSTFNQ